MRKCKILLFFAVLATLSGCQKYYLSICQEKIGRDYLASTPIKSPDPRQENPPFGQQLIIEWQIPKNLLKEHPLIELQIVYKDYEEASFIYPISYRTGCVVNSLLGEDFQKRKGFLSYKADIKTEDGTVFREWKHQFWVKVIRLEESHETAPAKPESTWDERDLDVEESEASGFFPPTS